MANLAVAALPDYLPPDTKVVIGFSLRGIIDSPLIASLGDPKTTTSSFLAGSPLAALDPLKDIDDLIVATTGEGDKAPSLLVLRGRFGPQLLPAGASVYHGVPILEDTKTPNGTVALLDAGTLLAGDLKLVHAAIDRRGTASGISAALMERVGVLEGRFDLWGVGEVPKGVAPPAGTPTELQSIDRFEFGVALRHGLEINIQAHMRSAKETEKMMQSVQLLQMMLQGQPSAGGTKFDLKAEHDTVKLAIFVPEEDLKKGIEAQKAKAVAAIKDTTVRVTGGTVTQVAPSTGAVVKNPNGDTTTVKLPRGR
jgi:hypothetical protein